MKYTDNLPRKIKEIENTWIPMPDGTKLAARIWMPEDAETDPVPAILEYIPYRKRDYKRIRDEMNHGYFAGHGYAGVRVDIRGSGDSEGILTDEYLEQELSDGEEIIKWLAAQPWCDGNVGMIGISWGGFNGLQIAARRPGALKAIITVCSTDDRYADDVHYMGGCLLGDNLSWASVMFSKNSLPPDPEIVGDKWKKMWLDRLEHSDLWLQKWLEHQTRDEYWKHGSVNENYDDIQCAVMAVSGWADGYSNAVFRMLKNLKVPRMGLVGPWSHRYPHDGEPGPAIGFLQESLRWWDRWLKGKETGIDKEPMVKAWVQDSVLPFTSYEERPGYWLGLNEWPSEKVKEEHWYLHSDNTLSMGENTRKPEAMWVKSPLSLGMFAGKWCSYSAPPDLPGDQRDEDGGALIFNSGILEENLEITGAPLAEFTISVDKPVAQIAVRLSDIHPDGKATRVTYGVLNLTHYKDHEFPEKLVPGKKYKVRIQLNEIGHIFPEGHRFRVSVSSSYFPLAWTPPEMATVLVHTEESRISLPVLNGESDQKVSFEEPLGVKPHSVKKTIKAPDYKWNVNRDLITNESTMEIIKEEDIFHLNEIDLKIRDFNIEKYSVRDDSLETVKGEVIWEKALERDDWKVKTYANTRLTSDKENFYIHATLDAYEGESRIFSKIWNEAIPRDHV
ncbi:MAG: CocE/NonD family hydrolase [Tangfeifania sp.]